MKSKRSGFTLIEISLFLALSAVLFVAVTVGVQNSIFQQRYNDSVQSFVDFLKNVYAEVNNVQNDVNGGTSNQAIYGKLVTFGESENFSGDENKNQTIFVYTVVGNIDNENGTGKTLELLKNLKANVLVKEGEDVKYAGMVESYDMKWSSVLQFTNPGTSGNFEDFKGALLIVRHPKSGVINTFVKNGTTIEVNQKKNDVTGAETPNIFSESDFAGFSSESVDFCVNPYGDNNSKNRVDVRINKNAKNSAGVGTFYDDDDNKCNNG